MAAEVTARRPAEASFRHRLILPVLPSMSLTVARAAGMRLKPR